MAKAGELIGGYRLIAQIGSGGQARVFSASKGEWASEVALKIIKAKASQQKKRERFMRELGIHVALASQQAPNIIQIIEHRLDEQDDGGLTGFLVMPKAAKSLMDAAALLEGVLSSVSRSSRGSFAGSPLRTRQG